MIITLYLEYRGVIIDDERIPYEMKEETARMWRSMYPGKELTIFYTAGSKLNYQKQEDEPVTEREQAADKAGNIGLNNRSGIF